jgi:hypothetical protein
MPGVADKPDRWHRWLFEPINVLMSLATPDLFSGYDVTPVRTQAAKVRALYESIQPPAQPGRGTGVRGLRSTGSSRC